MTKIEFFINRIINGVAMSSYVLCNYCGNEFKRLGLTRHLDSCRERQLYQANLYRKESLKKRKVALEEQKEQHRHEEEIMRARIELAQIEASRQVALKREDTKQLAITSQAFNGLARGEPLIIDSDWMETVIPRLGYHTIQFGNYVREKPKKNELIEWRDRSPHWVKDMLHLLSGGEYRTDLIGPEKNQFEEVRKKLVDSYENSEIDKLLNELD